MQAGLEDFLIDELLKVIGRYRRRVGIGGNHEALALVDANFELEVAHAHAIAVEQAARIALADRFVLAVHVDTPLLLMSAR